jgi:hypothetical protein
VETFSWPSTDGLTANGVVTYPPGFDSSKTYPLVQCSMHHQCLLLLLLSRQPRDTQATVLSCYN